jgi:tetratricopeptide (TPR) repeat protein
MTETPQETAERLAVQARLDSSRGKYPAAIEQQDEAVRILAQEFASLPQDSPALTDERKEYAHRLSDNWGKLGGIYRRADMITEAIEAYEKGKEIEQENGLDDSYNLTNWIVLQVLDDPARLPGLRKEIKGAIDLIQVQVQGSRRKQWWAWADLGLLYHLDGRVKEARQAYRRFEQAGARPADCRSVLDVVRPVKERVAPSEPQIAAGMAETIQALESAASRPAG